MIKIRGILFRERGKLKMSQFYLKKSTQFLKVGILTTFLMAGCYLASAEEQAVPDSWRIDQVKRGQIYDATYYNPVTGKTGAFEAGDKLPSYCLACLSKNTELVLSPAAVENPKPDQQIKEKGAVVGTIKSIVQEKVADNSKGGSYNLTKVWVLRGEKADVTNSSIVGDKTYKSSELSLETPNVASSKDQGVAGDGSPKDKANRAIITPCGFYVTESQPDPYAGVAGGQDLESFKARAMSEPISSKHMHSDEADYQDL